MTPRFPRPSSRQHLVQSTFNAYLDWREQCAMVTSTYECWADAPDGAEAEIAWEIYRAALDLEEKTSALYASLAEQLGTLSATDLWPGPRVGPASSLIFGHSSRLRRRRC
jgi:hypothetical protein